MNKKSGSVMAGVRGSADLISSLIFHALKQDLCVPASVHEHTDEAGAHSMQIPF